MKHLGISGGATKIAGQAGAAITVLRDLGYKPDYISGISAGSILSLPLALGLYDIIEKEVLGMNLDKIFSIKPVKSNGSLTLRGIIRALMSESSLGEMGGLRKTLERIITKERFNNYKKSNKYADVIIGSVDYKTGSRKYKFVRDLSYEDYLDNVLASSAIPVYAPSVNIKDYILYDGGVRDHCPTPWVLENIEGITKSVSIYSRPEDNHILDPAWKPENVIKVFERTLQIVLTELSKKDEWKEKFICKDKNIVSDIIYLPSILKELYDTDPGRILELYNKGKERGRLLNSNLLS